MSVLLFAGIMVFVCAKLFFSEIFLEAWETAIKAGQTLSFGQCIFFFICVLGEFICIFLALYNAKRIFGCISKGHSPFTNTTAIQIRKIALYVLLFAVFSVLSVFKMVFSSFFMCALFALILYCISLIFDYGCELQQGLYNFLIIYKLVNLYILRLAPSDEGAVIRELQSNSPFKE